MSFFDALSGESQLIIKHLQFTGIGFNPEASEKIKFFLMNTSSTTSLTIRCSFFCCDLYSQPEALNNIQKLHISTFRQNNDMFSVKMLKEYKMPKEFHVGSIIGFTQSLAESLGANDTLKSLVLETETEGAGSIHFDGNRWQIEEASKTITENKTLTELSLKPFYNGVDSSCGLAKAFCKNNTLEKLEITDMIIGVHHAEEFATILRNNTALKELQLLGCVPKNSEWTKIFLTLSSSLTHNRTLLKLLITLPPALLVHDKVISACAKDSRLHCESTS